MRKGKGLRTSDVSLLHEGGATFKVTLFPLRDDNDNSDWWYCRFSIHTQRDPNTHDNQIPLLTSRGDTWRMRDLNKAIRFVGDIFIDLGELTMKLRTAEEDVLLAE